MQMKKIFFVAAATMLTACTAMAQAVVTTPTPNATVPVPTGAATYSSTLVTGVDGSTWTTGTPGFYFASPNAIAVPPGMTPMSEMGLPGYDGTPGNNGNQD